MIFPTDWTTAALVAYAFLLGAIKIAWLQSMRRMFATSVASLQHPTEFRQVGAGRPYPSERPRPSLAARRPRCRPRQPSFSQPPRLELQSETRGPALLGALPELEPGRSAGRRCGAHGSLAKTTGDGAIGDLESERRRPEAGGRRLEAGGWRQEAGGGAPGCGERPGRGGLIKPIRRAVGGARGTVQYWRERHRPAGGGAVGTAGEPPQVQYNTGGPRYRPAGGWAAGTEGGPPGCRELPG